LRITLLNEAVLRARYTAMSAPYPDDTTGYVFATAQAPVGSPTGLEGVTMAIVPTPGRGPLFFEPNSDPDRRRAATSTWSSGLFAGVKPGEVTLTFGPQSVICVPLYGGWPSATPNSVRLAVAVGFETRVSMACHK
jgi:hypothetical protein